MNIAGNVVLKLDFLGDNVHKLNWVQLENTFRKFIPTCDAEELVVIKSLISFFTRFKIEFPSTLRNKLNYNCDSSIIDLEESLPKINLENINKYFIKGLLNLKTDNTYNSQIEAIAYLSMFLFKFNMKLYLEYIDRSKYGKDFNKERNNYLNKNNLVLHY